MPKKSHVIVILLSIGLSACIIVTKEASDNVCGDFVPKDIERMALERISFDTSAGWEEAGHGTWSGNGLPLLTIFAFDAGESTAEGCVDFILRSISTQENVDTITFQDPSPQIAGRPAVIAVADGFTVLENTRFRGVYAGVSTGDWVYVFAFDAFGDANVSTVTQEAALILGSTVFR